MDLEMFQSQCKSMADLVDIIWFAGAWEHSWESLHFCCLFAVLCWDAQQGTRFAFVIYCILKSSGMDNEDLEFCWLLMLHEITAYCISNFRISMYIKWHFLLLKS
jgi:hypothetical protein